MSKTNKRYITIGIGKDIISIPISNVVEIQEYDSITSLPQTPSWLKGLINLRGNILSVVDMTGFLGLPTLELSQSTKLIVLTGKLYQTAILADTVLEVVMIDESEIEPMKDGGKAESKIIKGVYNSGNELFTVLDVEAFMAENQMTQFQ